ncbi:MAG: class I SAM-dependent methyltransferase [Candidatus Pacebacteria bacterium]|nr:class I SAM-dependent methyltransferase [Candidatus Paceibacterota bacterium]
MIGDKKETKKTSKKGTFVAKKTSWGGVAGWYDKLLEQGDDTYQTKVILPNLVRAMSIKKGARVLDLACGQGFFSRAFALEGAEVAGVDISKELIALAQKQSPKEIRYFVRAADDLGVFQDGYFEKITIVLSLQNIEAPHKVFKECARILAPGGKLFIVLNHPAFRIPKESSWAYDEETKTQYRRIDRYMTESKAVIDMNPSHPGIVTTLSFHRPLQYYFKTLANAGFSVARLEEWLSHRESEEGPRKEAEDRARMEIPLFLFLEAQKSAQK